MFLRILNSYLFSKTIDKAFHFVVNGDHAHAYKYLEKIDIGNGRLWYYELLMAECLFANGDKNSSFTHFANLIDILNSSKFNASERTHAAAYIFKKYDYHLSNDLDEDSLQKYDQKVVRDRIRRYMPFEFV